MDFGLALLGVVGLAIVLAVVHVIGKMARERESAAGRGGARQRKEQRIVPLTDDTVTHLGHS